MQEFKGQAEHSEESIDLKELLLTILRFWPFIVISVVISLSIALIVNRYSRNIYELKTVLNVEESDDPLISSGVSLAFNWSASNKLESKTEVLKSYTLHENVVKSLGWR